jgi:hypothetical protein
MQVEELSEEWHAVGPTIFISAISHGEGSERGIFVEDVDSDLTT